MQASKPSTRIVTPARIVALALIAVLAGAGLAYLRFGSDAGTVSVPAGAHAGELILQSVQLRRPRTAATPPTAGRWSCPRTGRRRTRG